jgi:purine-cytosine permease-like protein
MNTQHPSALAPETHHIDVIPEFERHGRARDLFFLWFASNFNIGIAPYGALAVALGNDLLWSAVAVLVGNLFGAVFMAYHSAQGPILGVPQLIQSRGQFGYYGALLPVALAAILYGGFFILTALIAGQAMTAVIPGVGMTAAILIGCVISLALALFGYDLIHKAARMATWPLAVCVLGITVGSVAKGGLHSGTPGFRLGPFMLAVSLFATFQLTYAPYVSDYSRYLPSKTSLAATFWATYLGACLSVVWTQMLGVVLAVQYSKLTSLQAADQVLGAGGLGTTILIIMAVGIGGGNALNLYGSQLNLSTGIGSLRELPTGLAVRALLILPTFVIGVVIAILASSRFLTTVDNLLSVLQLTLVPWGAINLIDFYLVKRGKYNVASFFARHGVYYEDPPSWTRRGFALKALLCYALGVLAELPFANDPWIKGFLVDTLGGGDFSFIVGIIVPALLYYLLMHPWSSRTLPEDAPSRAGRRARRNQQTPPHSPPA